MESGKQKALKNGSFENESFMITFYSGLDQQSQFTDGVFHWMKWFQRNLWSPKNSDHSSLEFAANFGFHEPEPQVLDKGNRKFIKLTKRVHGI